MILQPSMQGVDNGSTSVLADSSPVLGGVPADFRLNGVEFTDLRQHRGGERRLRGGPEFVERASHVGPAERQRDRTVRATRSQTLEPVIAIDLQRAAERGQVSRRAAALAVL